MKTMIRPVFTISAIAAAIATSSGAMAQPVIEEVLVTATKRTVGMQDVPIALSVMTGDRIDEMGIKSLTDVAVYMPNVHIAEAGGGDQLFIRGVGSGVNQGFEQSVGTFIDGVYFGRGQASRTTFLDIERVEVLKGPQSTLFGKNTIAGALNITTARPGSEFEGIVEATAEPEFDGWSTTLTLSGPLTDTLGARFVAKREETDGWLHNTFLDEDERQAEDTVGRLVLTWAASETLDLTFKYESGESDTDGRQEIISIATDFAIDRYRVADPNFRPAFDYDKSSANVGGPRGGKVYHDSEWDITTLIAELALGEHTLKSTTGYVDYQYDNYLDSDSGPLAFLGRGRDEQHKQWTQEFLLSSPTGQTWEYLAGLYYQDEDLQHDRYTDAVLSAAGIGNGGFDASGIGAFQQDTTTWSTFAQLTWNLADSVRLIGGLRYSDDEKEFEKSLYVADLFTETPNPTLAGIYDQVLNFSTDHVFNGEGATVCKGVAYVCTSDPSFENKRTEDHWTGDVTLQWDTTESMMTYLKYGTGYKAGGFDEDNQRGRTDAEEFEDETVESWELGAKMDLWDNRARVNMALFYSQFDDVQVSTFDGNSGFIVGNAAKTETKGFEIDGQVALTEALRFMGALAYLDATYDSFPDAACNVEQIQAWIAAGNSRNSCVQDLSGEPLQFSPDWSANLALDYTTLVADGLELTLGVDAVYSDEYVVANDGDPLLSQDSYWKYNARIQLASTAETWSIAVLGKNLGDEKTTQWGNDVPLGGQGFDGTYFQHIDPPRSYEVRAKYRF